MAMNGFEWFWASGKSIYLFSQLLAHLSHLSIVQFLSLKQTIGFPFFPSLILSTYIAANLFPLNYHFILPATSPLLIIIPLPQLASIYHSQLLPFPFPHILTLAARFPPSALDPISASNSSFPRPNDSAFFRSLSLSLFSLHSRNYSRSSDASFAAAPSTPIPLSCFPPIEFRLTPRFRDGMKGIERRN
jgi:hypothetical protein